MAVLEKDQMTNLAENAVKTALKKGASEAEAYVYEGQATSIGIDLGQINKTNRIIDRGLGLRISLNKAIGFAYTNIIDDPSSVENLAIRALSAAKASKPDQDWKGLPEKKRYTPTEGTFDNKVVEIDSEELVNLSSIMLDSAGQVDKRVFPIEGGIGSAYVSNAIANSNGISAFDKGTFIQCSLATLAKENSAVTPVCFEFNAARSLKINPKQVGQEAAKLAVSALKTEPIETKTTTLILTQFALQELLAYTLINAVKADNVQRGQSPFKGKIGEKVAHENINVYDDGLLTEALRTSTFDAEGTPQQKTRIIEKGILTNFLYDHYTAKKEGKESTGNASRAGYLSTPNIETTNFHLTAGNKTPNQLINELDDGLLIYYLQGAHSSNPVSGEFSVVATPAWKIKKGEITNSTRGVMLAGNTFEILKNVSAIANNERQIGNLIAPWIQVENVKVIGK